MACANPTQAAAWEGWATEMAKLHGDVQTWFTENGIDDEEALIGSVEPDLIEVSGQHRWISQEEVFCNSVGEDFESLMKQGSGHRHKLKKFFVRAYQHVHGGVSGSQDCGFDESRAGEQRLGREGHFNGPPRPALQFARSTASAAGQSGS